MSISSEHPVGVEQVYRAMVALGVEPLFEPDVRPEGPRDEDRRRLLGALLAKVELETTTAMRPANEQDEGELLQGWIEQVGPDSKLSANVLINRLQRTGVQLLGLDEDETLPGQAASSMVMAVAGDVFGAHLCFREGDVDGVRLALGRAEASMIEVRQSMHDLRVAIGDAQEEPDR
ncbi:hypothetical protein [Embleya sp. MST-111070]|uniref:hypothetical protein n=1 Tax=Embleya sp. MST-111070 TaxID=3398231 RepID=UPI003F734E58